MHIKVHGGTRGSGQNLCRTCKKATRIVGAAESQEHTYCGEVGEVVKMAVVECSAYVDSRSPSLHDMRESAFYLVSKNNRTIGFVSAKEFKESNSEEFYLISASEG